MFFRIFEEPTKVSEFIISFHSFDSLTILTHPAICKIELGAYRDMRNKKNF